MTLFTFITSLTSIIPLFCAAISFFIAIEFHKESKHNTECYMSIFINIGYYLAALKFQSEHYPIPHEATLSMIGVFMGLTVNSVYGQLMRLQDIKNPNLSSKPQNILQVIKTAFGPKHKKGA